jgi:Uma2 family endonuclease
MVLAQRPGVGGLPLESGDRLSRDEFERRYLTRPDIKKAELVEGVVFVASPVRLSEHAEPHANIVYWLNHYRRRHRGLRIADNGTLRLDDRNEVQPDVMLFRPASAGGVAVVDEDGYVSGAPELVVEIAASSASHDLGAKMQAYQRSGVQEYVVWQILEERIEWFRLVEGSFRPLGPVRDQVFESQVFPGLRLDMAGLLAGNLDAAVAPMESP